MSRAIRSLIVLLFALLPATAGDLTARYELTLNRVLRGAPPRIDPDFLMADLIPAPTRRFTNYSGDLSGRYIEALSAVAKRGGAAGSLDALVTRAISLQKSDGRFGGPITTGAVTTDDMALLWGNGRMLVGLVEYYTLSHRADVLAAARRLGDFLVAQAPRFNSEAVKDEFNKQKFASGYICWTQNVESFALLYRVTNDARYLNMAKQIAARTDRHPSQHSHGFLTSIRGVLDLYRITHARRYLDQTRAAWQGVIDSGNVFISGGIPEMFAPETKRDEGCSEADWLRLTLELWQITHEAAYLEQAQRTWFNEFSFNQFATGDFGHHECSSTGMRPPAARAWWCCTFHGLRAMAALFSFVFRSEGPDIYYDLPLDGEGQARGLTIAATSSLERDANVHLGILRADGHPHQLAIRQPEWASAVEVTLAGASLATKSEGGYARITRTWRAGETMVVTYRMTTRAVPDPERARRVALFHGPWLLAVDESASPNFFDEPNSENRVQLAAGPEVELEPSTARIAPRNFTVPVAHFSIRYLPGGYPMQPARALLRPIAEFTTEPETSRLDFWFSRAGPK